MLKELYQFYLTEMVRVELCSTVYLVSELSLTCCDKIDWTLIFAYV